MATVNFYTPLQQALMGANPKIKRTRGSVINPDAGVLGAVANITDDWLAAFEKRRKEKDRSDFIAALTGSGKTFQYDPAQAKESFEPSLFLDTQRDAQLAADAQKKSFPLSQNNLLSLGDAKYTFDDLQSGKPLFQAKDPVETYFSDPSNKAAMQSALIGDVATPEQELAAYTGSAEDRAAQEKAFRENLNTPEAVQARVAALDPRVKRRPFYQSWQIGELAREQALADEQRKHKQALDLVEAGRAPVGMTKGITPSSKYPSGYAHINLRTGEILGEAPPPKAATEITIGGDLQKGFRTTAEGAEFIPGSSADPEVIEQKETAKKIAALNVKNLEKLPSKRSAIFADHLKTPTLKTSISRAIDLAESPLSSGMTQFILDKVPLPEVAGVNLGAAYDLNIALDSVKANVGFNELLRIKEAGGTLGALSEMENRLLQAMQGALVAAQDKDTLIPALRKVEEIWELNLQQKKNEFKTMYSKDGGWKKDERRPWEPPPGAELTQEEWDAMTAAERKLFE